MCIVRQSRLEITNKQKKPLGSFPEADSKTPLLKTTPTEFNEHGEIELLPTINEVEHSFLCANIFGMGRYSAVY